jgi:hypothetical protein
MSQSWIPGSFHSKKCTVSTLYMTQYASGDTEMKKRYKHWGRWRVGIWAPY